MSGCVDVSWLPGTPGGELNLLPQRGNTTNGVVACYLKSAAQQVNINSNVWGARQISGCTVPVKPFEKRGALHAGSTAVRTIATVSLRSASYAGPDYTWTSSRPALATVIT